MADDEAIAASSGGDGGSLLSEKEEIPLRTRRSFDACTKRFSHALADCTKANVARRGSQTPTDADVENAYRQLMRDQTPNKLQRCVGDGTMIAGGIMIPLWNSSPVATVAGVLLCVVGLYVREFAK